MKYNDEVLDIGRFDVIAKEYNKQRVTLLAIPDNFVFNEVLHIAGKLLGIMSRSRFRYIKNKRFGEFHGALRGTMKLLNEFCFGECGREIEQIKSEHTIADIHKLLCELISKMIRVVIDDPQKKEIFNNIIDKFLELLLKLFEREAAR